MSDKPSGNPRRGEVWLVAFDPTRGAEIQKTRPALIVQNDIGNRHSDITIVAAISSQVSKPLYPVEVLIRQGEAHLQKESVILLNQIRSIDKQRLLHRIGKVAPRTMAQVNKAIRLSLAVDE